MHVCLSSQIHTFHLFLLLLLLNVGSQQDCDLRIKQCRIKNELKEIKEKEKPQQHTRKIPID